MWPPNFGGAPTDGEVAGIFIEATRLLKSEQETRGIPIIALTAHAMPTEREKAIQAGCDEYESKPIEFAKLLRKIEMLLRNTNQEIAV